jgi:hypothetical protein
MNKQSFITIGILIAIFLFALQPAIDPDTGWHLATGRYIVEHGQVPQNDPFSYSMPDTAYYAHSWALDTVMYLLQNWLGPQGLSVFFALLTTASMALFARIANRLHPQGNAYVVLPLLALMTIEISGVRPQVVSIVGLAMLLVMLTSLVKKPPMWQIPLLFFVWANLHGGVVLGVGVFTLWIIVSYVLRQKDFDLKYWTTNLFIACVATLINPYTYHLYSFAFGMVINKTAMIYNADWVPLFSSRLGDESLLLRVSIVVGSIVAILDNKHLKIMSILAGVFLGASLKSLRFLVPLLPIIAPLMLITLHRLTQSVTRKGWFAQVVVILVAVLSYGSLVDKKDVRCTAEPECYGSLAQMPHGATTFIKENGLVGNFFNYYTWGGYLEWQVPQAKFFIDGRMDNFFIDGKSFLEEFVSVDQMQAGWYERLIEYQTDFALIPSNWQKQATLLKEQGWSERYRDEISILLER